MPLPVAEVLEEAREVHPGFSRHAVLDRILLAALGRYVVTLTGIIAKWNPEVLTSTESIALPLADFDAGHTLPDFLVLLRDGVLHFAPDGRRRIEQVAAAVRMAPPVWPSWYVQGSTLHLCGLERDWVSYTQLDVRYIPRPAVGLTLADTIALPDEARPALVDYVAMFASRRVPDLEAQPPVPRAELVRVHQQSEGALLDQMGRRQATVDMIEEVW